MSLALLLLSWMALAVVPDGRIVIETTPGATVELLPGRTADTAELMVHGNVKPLDDQLHNQRTAHIDEAWATAIGGGAWFLSLHLRDPDLRVEVHAIDPVRWTIQTKRAPRRDPPQPETITIAQLLGDEAIRRPARPASMALTPLLSDAWQARAPSDRRPLPFEDWRPPLPNLADGPASLERIDALRAALASTQEPNQRAALLQHLALTHRDLGLNREASAYFDTAARYPGQRDPSTVLLHRADAALAIRRFDRARGYCNEAHEQGAPPHAVLSCLGQIALATGSPAPSPTARALLRAEADADGHLLAAQLLLIDGRFDEAAAALDRLPRDAEHHPWREAARGDVALMLGDRDAAHAAWRSVEDTHTAADLPAVRLKLIALLDAAPTTWASAIPELRMLAEGDGPASVEALHLLSQIARAYDDPSLGGWALGELIDRDPTLAQRAGAHPRLVEVCSHRLDQLHRLGASIEVAATFGECWRESLDPLLRDGLPLQHAADAYADLGLWDVASALQRRAVGAYVRSGRDDVAALRRLADLYRRTGQAEVALETTAYALERAGDPVERARLASIDAEIHLARGDRSAAEAAWSRALAVDDLAELIRDRRALAQAEAGACAAAATRLGEVRDAHRPGWEDATLALSRCALRSDDPRAATEHLAALTSETADPVWTDQAGWLLGAARTRSAADALDDPSMPVPAPWPAALDALRRADAADARADVLQAP